MENSFVRVSRYGLGNATSLYLWAIFASIVSGLGTHYLQSDGVIPSMR
ncbi:MAG: hypothetical protein AAF773_20765 [Cyanobacteria bacterium P01_D01_bin.115]